MSSGELSATTKAQALPNLLDPMEGALKHEKMGKKKARKMRDSP